MFNLCPAKVVPKQALMARHTSCRCGPGNHSVQLALKGHRVVALDSSQGLLTFARSKADKEGVDIKFLRKDMEDFELPVRTLHPSSSMCIKQVSGHH